MIKHYPILTPKSGICYAFYFHKQEDKYTLKNKSGFGFVFSWLQALPEWYVMLFHFSFGFMYYFDGWDSDDIGTDM